MNWLKSPVDTGPHGAQLHIFGVAALPSPLRNITLENILAGDTCAPLGLSDFEAYLSFVDRSIENLQFIVWFQSYRERFHALPQEVQALSPSPTTTHFGLSHETISPSSRHESPTFKRVGTTDSTGTDLTFHEDPLRSPNSPLSPTSTHALLPGQSTILSPTRATSYNQQAGRDECSRIVATFFAPNSTKQLNLDADIRDHVLSHLAHNTHPDIFLPVYDAIYTTLQTVTLPRFLGAMMLTINYPKQLWFYSLGLVAFIVSSLLFALITAYPPWPDLRSRALRMVCVLPFVASALWIYSGVWGVCSVVTRRKRMQLRAWELEAMSARDQAWWANIASVPPLVDEYGVGRDDKKTTGDAEIGQQTGRSNEALPAELSAIAVLRARERREAILVDITDPQPSSQRNSKAGLSRPSPPVTISFATNAMVQDLHDEWPEDSQTKATGGDLGTVAPHTRYSHPFSAGAMGMRSTGVDGMRPRRESASGYRAPPIFGPERVVMDPRVLAVHRRTLMKLILLGGITGSVAVLLCMCIPVVH